MYIQPETDPNIWDKYNMDDYCHSNYLWHTKKIKIKEKHHIMSNALNTY